MIYLDHAATTPVRKEALEAMLPYFSELDANASASYSSARRARSAVEHARMQVSKAIGANKPEIYFVSGGTEADNWALFGPAAANGRRKRIVTTTIEHHAVLHTCKKLEREGYEVIYLRPDSNGQIQISDARASINDNTLLVSVMLANNETGVIQPVAEIAELSHKAGALMHTDAVQAVGHIPIDVNKLGVDLLSLSAHKFYGPKGIGALYAKSGVRMGTLMYGGEQERGMRPGTENVPAIVGMGKAIELAIQEIEDDMKRLASLRDLLEAQLMDIDGIRINGKDAKRLPGHIHLTVSGQESSMLLARLDMQGIAASAGSACASGSIKRSHVLESMFPDEKQAADIRLSLGCSNHAEQMRITAAALKEILNS